jgi:hypothetical protein
MAKSEVERQAKSRRKRLLEQLGRDGFESAKEAQDLARELDLPWTWTARKLDGHVGAEDLLPSRKSLDTLRRRSKKS